MGYLHIDNLYKDKTILLFKECYAMEKIHGTSAHLKWENGVLTYFSGGANIDHFKSLFDHSALESKANNITIYGEAYGGKMNGMCKVYGASLRFVAFDVLIDEKWVPVNEAEKIVAGIGLEFVQYSRIKADLEDIDAERDKPSAQAERNGMGKQPREGVILRPLIELVDNRGKRIISKHKGEEYKECMTHKRPGNDPVVLTEAAEIAAEWVTDMRLNHVMDHILGIVGRPLEMSDIPTVCKAMVEDVYREGVGELLESKDTSKAISRKAVEMFKKRIIQVGP